MRYVRVLATGLTVLTLLGSAATTLAAADPGAVVPRAGPFVHPGLLHTEADFARMKERVAKGDHPWIDGWWMLTKNPHAATAWRPRPQVVVYRGSDHVHPENYAALFNDAAAAYALALRWRVSGDDGFADAAVTILNAWAATLTAIGGSSDRYLASGLYGYQLANAGEILRTYKNWQAPDRQRFQAMMLGIFYPMNHDFLTRHDGAKIDHYWSNWDLANMSSMLAIGVLVDRRDIYDEAIQYFKTGAGNGSIEHAVWKVYPNGLGQLQESGRDQGHATLVVALLGAFCQMAWNQGDDLFGYDDQRVLKGAEYAAKYNLGDDVPYTPYSNSDVTQATISSAGRGTIRPIWELIYNHYVVLRGQHAPAVEKFASKVRPEGGGGDYGPNSGGFDQLGYGTLTFTVRPD